MEESRTINSLKNISMNIVGQILLIGLRFAARTIFIRYLSIEYLGIDGLFSNILSVLALADLGITSALNYSLYKPLRENDQEKIKQLMNYFKKIYLLIAAFVLGMGLSLVPFLQYIVNLDRAVPNIRFYYILMLLSVVMSYLFVYRSALVIASQKEYLVTRITVFTQFLKIVFQIILLYLFQSFALYLGVKTVIELIDNLIVSRTATKLYPYLKQNKAVLAKSDRKAIIDNIKSIFIYRFGGIVMNNTTDIFISVIVGTIYVGFYSNYMMVVSSVSGILNLFFSSISASVGNKNASKDKKEQERLFRLMTFITQWLMGFGAICFFILLSPFVKLWLGAEFVLPLSVILAIALQFYVSGMLSTVAIYRDTTGIFKETKYVFLVTAFLNILFCFVFGHYLGITGILLAATCARLLTNFWFEPKILHNTYFETKSRRYFLTLAKYGAVTAVQGAGLLFFSRALALEGVQGFILLLLLCVLVINGSNLLVYWKDPSFRQFLHYLQLLKQAAGEKLVLLKKREEG